MPEHDKMKIAARFTYLEREQADYLAADRQERGALLTHMEKVTGLKRKTLIRLMRGDLQRKPRATQRGRTYDHEVADAIRVVAESLDYITAERLTPTLADTARDLMRHGELSVTPRVLALLETISISTVGRILRRLGRDKPRLPRKGPHEANRVRREVPMRVIPWNETEPGHFETDLVYHSGPVIAGDHVHTIQLIDVATGWSERVAVLGRSYLVMRDAFQHIVDRAPFPIIEIHPDNGSEFFNDHLVRFWGQAIPGLALSRSRPMHKNDNRFVEQKNDSLVRAFVGRERLDTVAQTLALNALYEEMWVYYNLFQPVMRLAEKHTTRDEQGHLHVHRRFDRAQTPFQRVCATGVLTPSKVEELTRLHDSINPRRLRLSIYEQLERLFKLPLATKGITEDVYATLMHPILTETEVGSR